MVGTRFTLEVQPVIPEALNRLPQLADDLVYSWNRPVRALFSRLDRHLWHDCGHNPRVFLRRVAQSKLDDAASNLVYLQDYKRVLSDYDTYKSKEPKAEILRHLDPARNLVAYFCFEFGLHESFPIYSGGLGILAGDHCKAASDLGLPFVAVSLLYHQGYFTQIIDGHGQQQVQHQGIDLADLPVSPVFDDRGGHLTVEMELPERTVKIQVWQAIVGHIRLYLLDSDVPGNAEADRAITYQLYGGDVHTRIQQEMILGIGGVRALRAMNLHPTVWHINEGHAAFMILERCRERVAEGLEPTAALELIAAATVFTTHTPVPAGHDIFDRGLMHQYFAAFAKELKVDWEAFMSLGMSHNDQAGFNQTALALRGSRFHNGVSRLHGEVASRMEGYIWPDVPPEENPLDAIPNGVHVMTFLAGGWVNLFDQRFGSQWRDELQNESFWERIDELPDATFWSVRQILKFDLIKELRYRATVQYRRNGCSDSQIKRLTRFLSSEEDILFIGFARRFATYKRATLLFHEPERLARLVNQSERPVVFVFAGKAHPHDRPGQELIHAIHQFAMRPEFEGRILLLEGYDLALARKMVTGVDVWLNTPQHPLEASGTSGMKAGMNGVINLSVLDGWWADGYDGENGWAVTAHSPDIPAPQRDAMEANELLEILEHEVVPLFYERNRHGYSKGWVGRCKASMKSLLPRWNAERMVMDYVRKLYTPSGHHHTQLAADDCRPAWELARWKARIHQHWAGVGLRLVEQPSATLRSSESLRLQVAAKLEPLEVEDVMVECLVGRLDQGEQLEVQDIQAFSPCGRDESGDALFELQLQPALSGLQCFKIRMYPFHPLLAHRFETGLMVWV